MIKLVASVSSPISCIPSPASCPAQPATLELIGVQVISQPSMLRAAAYLLAIDAITGSTRTLGRILAAVATRRRCLSGNRCACPKPVRVPDPALRVPDIQICAVLHAMLHLGPEPRRALAEKAQREMERREAQEKAYSPCTSLPPIHAEISDESDGEDDLSPSSDHHIPSAATPRIASYPATQNVPEPDLEPQAPVPVPAPAPAPAPSSPLPAPSSPLLAPRSATRPRSDESVPLAHTRDASSLSLPTPSSDASLSPRGSTSSHSRQASITTPSVTTSSIPTTVDATPIPVSTTPVSAIRTSGGIAAFQAKFTTPTRPGSGAATRTHSYSSIPMSSPRAQEYSSRSQHSRTSSDMAAALPSPAASSVGTQGYGNTFSSTIGAQRTSAQSFGPQQSLSSSTSGSMFVSNVHPSEWTVEQVVAWLRSKGFDDGVCSKFFEHEITGDVLLDLDANLHKELDIAAFGKRMRIANAIPELQRPPSIVSSENSATRLTQQQQQQQQMRHQSNDSGVSPLMTSLVSPESPPHSGDIAVTPDRRSHPSSEPGTALSAVGLGFNTPDRNVLNGKGTHPAALNLNTSPSDSALKACAALAQCGPHRWMLAETMLAAGLDPLPSSPFLLLRIVLARSFHVTKALKTSAARRSARSDNVE
ncbi:hypothetical protein AURDEDRAFT_160781 [Auricularia subglabra TFB-10046 SS5]|nr:hypothetical protein AURDEDRAFT_160781 [Auricularia subglabra TFB-10046 SS5]